MIRYDYMAGNNLSYSLCVWKVAIMYRHWNRVIRLLAAIRCVGCVVVGERSIWRLEGVKS
jgi:hypothetical protein